MTAGWVEELPGGQGAERNSRWALQAINTTRSRTRLVYTGISMVTDIRSNRLNGSVLQFPVLEVLTRGHRAPGPRIARVKNIR